jgi:hypothetical protein
MFTVKVENGVMTATVSLPIPEGWQWVKRGLARKGDKYLSCSRTLSVASWITVGDGGDKVKPTTGLIRKVQSKKAKK